jgi:UDP-glucose 4-epimerase
MKVLVTGGAGFIGSHLCEGLLREGYQVRVLDDLSVGKLENVPAECEFIQGSILDPNIVEQAVNGVTHILHDAARVTIRGSVDKFYEDAETNLMGTLQLLKTASKQKVQRFIYASSMAVYADSEEPVPISENYSQLPASPYGIAKLAAERYVLLTSADFGMQPVVLRYFNTFGTRQTYTPYVGVITIFITRLLKKQNLTIFGDGEQRRDFVHVSDIVQANLLALKNDSAVGETFNVGTGIGTSVNELAQLLT